jgi:hypothetical protein
MKISFAGIYDRGDLSKERLHFRADTDVDLSFFVLFDTQLLTAGQVSAGNHPSYWFTPRKIPRGQHVVVYTRAGSPSSEPRSNGHIYNFIFRGLIAPIYTQPQVSSVIMELQTWAVSPQSPTALPPLAPLVPDYAALISALGTGNTLGDLPDTSGLGDATLADLMSFKPKQ